MSVSLMKDQKLVNAQLRIKSIADNWGICPPDRIAGRGWKREKHLILRPGNCSNRSGLCDCPSGTTRPIVDLNRVHWH